MTVLYIFLLIIFCLVLFYISEIVSLFFRYINAYMDIYDALSFEFITREECIQRLEKSKSKYIQKLLNRKFLYISNISADTIIDIIKDAFERVVYKYSQEDLLVRKYLFEHLEEKYKKRYLDFLSGTTREQIKTKSLCNALEEYEDDDTEEKRFLTLLYEHSKEISETMEVVMIRKKPGGKRPPKKTAVIQNIFLPAGGRA